MIKTLNVTANCFLHHVDHRRFRMVTKFNGQVVASQTKGQKKAALASLEEELTARNFPLPKGWNIKEVDPAITAELVAKSAPKEPVIRFDARDEAPILENPDEVECENPFILEAVKVPEPKAPVAPKAPALDYGMITPISAKEAWVATYLEAVQASLPSFMAETREEDFGPDNNRVTRYRDQVNTLMKAAGCVGAYESTPSGDRWIRFSGAIDLTVGQVQKKGRNQYKKDVNGNITPIEHGEVGKPGSVEKTRTARANAEYKYAGGSAEEQKSAYNFANTFKEKEAKRIASASGVTITEARKTASACSHFMAGFLIGCRSMGLPTHTVYAAKLKSRGYDLSFDNAGNATLSEDGQVVFIYETAERARKAS